MASSSDLLLSVGLDTSPALRAVNDFARSVKPVNLKFNSQPLGTISKDINTFRESLRAAEIRTVAFASAAGQLFAVQRAFQAITKSTIETEKSLTDINVVLGLSQKQLAQFSSGLFKVANETGASFQVAADGAVELSRQGLSAAETLKRLKDALTLTRLSGLDVGKSVSAITAAINSFNDAALDSTAIVNKLASVDAQFAVSSGDLADSLSRVGSTARDTGVSFDELIGFITAAKQITQRDGSVIGNALKTIFQRIQRPEVLDNLRELGVLTRTVNGETLGSQQILVNLAKTYTTLSSAQQNQVVQLSAGVYQANQFRAILNDLSKENSIYARAVGVSSSATDQAARRQTELNKTLAASINETVNKLTQVSAKVGDLTLKPVFDTILGQIKSGADLLSGSVGDSGATVGSTLGEGILKGIGNYLSGPGLILGGALIFKLIGSFASTAIKSLGTILETGTSRVRQEEAIRNLLSQQTGLMGEILALGGNQGEIEKRIGLAISQNNAALNQQLKVVSEIAAITSSGLAGRNLSSKPFTVKSGNITRAAVGIIPSIQESIGAIQAGYQPGKIKQLNIPRLGNVVYNDAEKVKYFPGLNQPAIIPPQNSKAGVNYKASFQNAHGFNPYKSEGLVPNFAQSITSAETSTNQVPGLFKSKRFGKQLGPRNIDIGGGKYNSGTEFLKKKFGIESRVYDPFNRSEEFNNETLRQLFGNADTATVANVLNVIKEPEARKALLEFTKNSTKKNGVSYFSIYERNRSGIGVKTSKGWQNNQKASSYEDEISAVFPHIRRRGNIIAASESPLPDANKGLVPNFSLLDDARKNLAGRKFGIDKKFQTKFSHAIKDSIGRHMDEQGMQEVISFFGNPVFDPTRIIRAEPSRHGTPGELEIEYIVPSKSGDGTIGQRLKIAVDPSQLEKSRLINILPRHGIAANGLVPNYSIKYPTVSQSRKANEKYFGNLLESRSIDQIKTTALNTNYGTKGNYPNTISSQKYLDVDLNKVKGGVSYRDKVNFEELLSNIGSRGQKFINNKGYIPNFNIITPDLIKKVSPEILSTFTKGGDLLKYIKSLGLKGNAGSSRLFLPLSSKVGLKVALNKAGVAQNETEFPILGNDYYARQQYDDILPQGHRYDENNFLYGFMERLSGASAEDFRTATGKPKRDFLKDYATTGKLSEIEEQIVEFARNYDLNIGDFLGGRNVGLGQTSSGKSGLKLLDVGASERVMREFYQKRNLGAFGQTRKNIPIKFGSKGLIPNFAPTFNLDNYFKNLIESKNGYLSYTVDKNVDPNKAIINNIVKKLGYKGGGVGNELYPLLNQELQGKGINKVFGALINQDRTPTSDSPIDILKSKFPQLSRGKFAKENILTVEGTDYNLKGGEGFNKDLKLLSRQILRQMVYPKSNGIHLESFLNKGLVPNYSALSSAIKRENAAGIPYSQIRVGSSPAIKSSFNPLGLGVYNTKDEPHGLGQGIARVAAQGLDPKRAGIPNYANYYKKINDIQGNPTDYNRLIEGDTLKSLETEINKYKEQIRIGTRNQGDINAAVDTLTESFNLTSKSSKQIADRFKKTLTRSVSDQNRNKGAVRTQQSGLVSGEEPGQLVFGAFSGGNQGEFIGVAQQADLANKKKQEKLVRERNARVQKEYEDQLLGVKSKAQIEMYQLNAKAPTPNANENKRVLEYAKNKARLSVTSTETEADVLRESKKILSQAKVAGATPEIVNQIARDARERRLQATRNAEDRLIEKNRLEVSARKAYQGEYENTPKTKAQIEEGQLNYDYTPERNKKRRQLLRSVERNLDISVGGTGQNFDISKFMTQSRAKAKAIRDSGILSQEEKDSALEKIREQRRQAINIGRNKKLMAEQAAKNQAELKLTQDSESAYRKQGFLQSLNPFSRVARNNEKLYGNTQAGAAYKNSFQNKAFLAGFAISPLAGIGEQAVLNSGGAESKNGRGIARTIGAAGTIGSSALQGAAVGATAGGAFGFPGIAVGAIGGGAIGLLTELPGILDAFTNTLPDLQRELELTTEAAKKTSDSFTGYIESAEQLKNFNGTKLQYRQLESVNAASLASLPVNTPGRKDIIKAVSSQQFDKAREIQASNDYNANLLLRLQQDQINFKSTGYSQKDKKIINSIRGDRSAIGLQYQGLSYGGNASQIGNNINQYKNKIAENTTNFFQNSDFIQNFRSAFAQTLASSYFTPGKNGENGKINPTFDLLQQSGLSSASGSKNILSSLDKAIKGTTDVGLISNLEKLKEKIDEIKNDSRFDNVKKEEQISDVIKNIFKDFTDGLINIKIGATKSAREIDNLNEKLLKFSKSIIDANSSFEKNAIMQSYDLAGQTSKRELKFASTKQLSLAADPNNLKLENQLATQEALLKIGGRKQESLQSSSQLFIGEASKGILSSYEEELNKLKDKSLDKNIGQSEKELIIKRIDSLSSLLDNNEIYKLLKNKSQDGSLTDSDVNEIVKKLEDQSKNAETLLQVSDSVDTAINEYKTYLSERGSQYATKNLGIPPTSFLAFYNNKLAKAGDPSSANGYKTLPDFISSQFKGVGANEKDVETFRNNFYAQRLLSQSSLTSSSVGYKAKKDKEIRDLNFNKEFEKNANDIGYQYNNKNTEINDQYNRENILRLAEKQLSFKSLQRNNAFEINKIGANPFQLNALTEKNNLANFTGDRLLQLRKSADKFQNVKSVGNIDELLKENNQKISSIRNNSIQRPGLIEELQKQIDLIESSNRELLKTKEDITAEQEKSNERLKYSNELDEKSLKFAENRARALRTVNQGASVGKGSDINQVDNLTSGLQFTSTEFWDTMSQNNEQFGSEFKNTFKEAFGSAIQNGESLSKSLEKSFLNFANNIAVKNVNLALDSIFGAVFDGLSSVGIGGGTKGKTGSAESSILTDLLGSLFSGKANGGLIPRYANGGFVNMGSGVKDDVPALLSGGEYVIRKSSVNKIGKRNLDRMNNAKGYASGGSFIKRFDNEFATTGDALRPDDGYLKVDPNLSSIAQTDENNPQNALKFARENYIYDKRAYDAENKKTLAKYEKSQKTSAYIAFGSAVLGAVGSAYAQSKASKSAAADQAFAAGEGPVSGSYAKSLGYTGSSTFKASDVKSSLGQSAYSNVAQNSFARPYSSPYFRANGGLIRGFAQGGMFGADSPMDKYPAMLMGGEYVVKKPVVDTLGSRFFDTINKTGRPPRGYADGGYVGTSSVGKTEDVSKYFAEFVSVSKEIRDTLGGKQSGGATQSAGVNISVNTNITIAGNGEQSQSTTVTSNEDTSKKDNKQSSFTNEDAKKLSDSINAQINQALVKESKNGGILYERFKTRA